MLQNDLPGVSKRGDELLRDARRNKFTAFDEAERRELGLTGLLPEALESQEIQVRRVVAQVAGLASNLDRYRYLARLREDNEALFFAAVRSDPASFLPLVYTPTVGEACLKWSAIIERPRGLYLGINRRGRVREILRNWPEPDVRFVVVTSGERILGLGDLGANGMGIPIGKLALYTACAGVPPRHTMPVLMDCGTGNQALLDDPLYLGLRQPRPTVAQLDEFVEEFVAAVGQEFPNCCIQFEDWARADALRLLARYRERICCFNDDLQNSGAVVVAGMLNALRIAGGRLRDQTFLFLGAGSAAIGIGWLLSKAMVQEGLSLAEAQARIWLFNRHGLVESTRTDLANYHRPFAHQHPPIADFKAAIQSLRPSAIIGVSTAAKAFDREVIEAMAGINRRPIIFALSNPTSHSECTAEEAYRFSRGRAIFASGSPFGPVRYEDRTLVAGQCNNLYVFPAIGLAVYATRARRVTDEMFIAAARAVAEQVSAAQLETGLIYPPQSAIVDSEIHVAKRVAGMIFDQDLACVSRPNDLREFIESLVYQPAYQRLA